MKKNVQQTRVHGFPVHRSAIKIYRTNKEQQTEGGYGGGAVIFVGGVSYGGTVFPWCGGMSGVTEEVTDLPSWCMEEVGFQWGGGFEGRGFCVEGEIS